MNLKVFSNKIVDQIKEDVNNPEIFNNLRLLASFFFRGTKFVSNQEQVEEISNIAAEDMYLKIYKGVEIQNPIAYLYSYRYTYLKEMQKMLYTEVIEAPTYDIKMSVITMCMGSALSIKKDYDKIWLVDYLERIPDKVDSILSKVCRYKKGTSIYSDIYISIILSLYLDDESALFIEQKLHNYFLLMLNKIRNELYEDIKYNLLDSSEFNYDGNLEILLNVLRVSNEEMFISEE